MQDSPHPLPDRLRVYLIKPSKYDDAGRVLSFWKGILPSNTLTVLNALVLGWNDHRPADLKTLTETVLWDELVHGPVGPEFLDRVRGETAAPGSQALIFVCGAQTNEYFRARDIAVWLSRAGLSVAIGGFHISGHKPSRDYLETQGVTTVVGEAEGLIALILEDAARGRLEAHYSHTSGIRAKTGKDPIWVPDIVAAPLPVLDPDYLGRFMNRTMTTVDTSRGCPFTCSYCSVKNVMGRTMRSRDPKRLIDWVRRVYDEHGIRFLFLVDDNFYRNPRWEEVLDGFIALRAEGRELGFMMQVDVAASARQFLDKSAAAGCYQVFVGFESFSPRNLLAASKNQNRNVHTSTDEEQGRAEIVEKYRRVVRNWHEVGVAVHGAGMIGFPWDGPDAGRRMAHDFIDIGLDQASFFILTPLPGTEDWDAALGECRVEDFDFDHYETTRPVARHPRLTPAQLTAAYQHANDTFYNPARLPHVLAAYIRDRELCYAARRNRVRQFLWYSFSRLRHRHPMIGGLWMTANDGLRELMAKHTQPEAARGRVRLSQAFAELSAWRVDVSKERFANAVESLSQAVAAALARLKQEPLVEDDEGPKPLAYLVPQLEALRDEIRDLARRAEGMQVPVRFAALRRAVEARLATHWQDPRGLGSAEARQYERVLRDVRARLAVAEERR